jgi:hypothetical protein
VKRSRIYFACGLLILCALAISGTRPHAFQKLNTVVSAEGFEALLSPAEPVDIAGIIASTPVKAGAAVAVDPAEKYRLTIEEGMGNCSERSFGLAWKLRQTNVDLQIVHLLPTELFVEGHGHSMLRIPYADGATTRIGLVDLLEGGLPMGGGEPLDIEDLTHGSIDDFSVRSLSGLHDDQSPYYGEFLDGVMVGFVPAREVDRYLAIK